MQKIVSILLIFALTAQCMSQLGVFIGYEIHKDYIAENICVNRDHPELACEGQCYLHQKMDEDQQHKEDHNGNTRTQLEVTLFYSTIDISLHFESKTATHLFSPVAIREYASPIFSFYHPPKI